MAPITDLDKRATSTGFGLLVGITEPAVAKHRKSGVLPVDGTYREWLIAYCEHMRNGDSFALTVARARLAEEQADRVAMENAVSRGTLAPRSAMEEAIADGARQAVAILDGVPAMVKRASATIKARDLAVVKREIDKAREAIAAITLSA